MPDGAMGEMSDSPRTVLLFCPSMGRRWHPQILSLVFFGPAAFGVYYSAFRPPPCLADFLASGVGLEVVATVLWAVLAAYCCRRVVQALLQLCGFG